MSKFFALACISLFLTFLSCSNEQNLSGGLDFKKIEKQSTVVLKQKKVKNWLKSGGDSLTLVFFYADWCKICSSFKPVLLTILNNNKGLIRTGTVNTDREKKLVEEYSITSLPTIKFFRGNTLLYTAVGSLKEQELQILIDKFIKSKI